MPFTINRPVAVALATIAFLTFNSARSVVVGASASDNSETPGVAQSDDGSDGQECKNIKELETLFRGKETSLLFYKGLDYEGVDQLVERAIQEGEKNPKAAKELVDFTAENLYLNRLTRFLRLQYAIQNARKNESSVFRRDDVFEKLCFSVNYFERFEEAYKAEGVAGVDKVLDQFAQDVQKDPKLLVGYKELDEMMTGTEDDVILRFNSQKLGDKFKKIVALATLRELQKNRKLVPMPWKDFVEMFVCAIPKMNDAEFTDAVVRIWFIVAFEDDGKRDDGYRAQVDGVEGILSKVSEEKADAFTERVLSLLNTDETKESYKREDDGLAYRLVFRRLQRRILAAIKSDNSEELEKLIADLIERIKEYDPIRLTHGSFRYDLLRDLEVVRPDLAFLAYDEVAKRCRDPKLADCRLEMETGAFCCESIGAILAADLPALEKLADKLAEKTLDPTSVKKRDIDGVIKEFDYLLYQKSAYANSFLVRYVHSRTGREILDRAISALEKSEKSNAKLLRDVLVDVRNDPRVR